jgi:hypothetical protein
MNLVISEERIFKLIEKYLKSVFGDFMIQQIGDGYNIWGTDRFTPPTTEDSDTIPPYFLNHYGILWNNLGKKSPHYQLQDIFGLDGEELLMFYLEHKFHLDIRGFDNEDVSFLEESVDLGLKRRLHIIEKFINSTVSEMYLCDYNNSVSFVDAVVIEVIDSMEIYENENLSKIKGLANYIYENYSEELMKQWWANCGN